jgi:hypothetical protein
MLTARTGAGPAYKPVQGRHSQIFIVDNVAKLQSELNSDEGYKYFSTRNSSSQSGPFIVKMATYTSNLTFAQWLNLRYREAQQYILLHNAAMSSPIQRNCKVIPDIFFSGYHKSDEIYYYVMQAPEYPNDLISIKRLRETRAVTIDVCRAVEAAVMSMWRLGVSQGSLRHDNILYSLASQRAYVVDLDTIMNLTGNFRNKLESIVKNFPGLNECNKLVSEETGDQPYATSMWRSAGGVQEGKMLAMTAKKIFGRRQDLMLEVTYLDELWNERSSKTEQNLKQLTIGESTYQKEREEARRQAAISAKQQRLAQRQMRQRTPGQSSVSFTRPILRRVLIGANKGEGWVSREHGKAWRSVFFTNLFNEERKPFFKGGGSGGSGRAPGLSLGTTETLTYQMPTSSPSRYDEDDESDGASDGESDTQTIDGADDGYSGVAEGGFNTANTSELNSDTAVATILKNLFANKKSAGAFTRRLFLIYPLQFVRQALNDNSYVAQYQSRQNANKRMLESLVYASIIQGMAEGLLQADLPRAPTNAIGIAGLMTSRIPMQPPPPEGDEYKKSVKNAMEDKGSLMPLAKQLSEYLTRHREASVAILQRLTKLVNQLAGNGPINSIKQFRALVFRAEGLDTYQTTIQDDARYWPSILVASEASATVEYELNKLPDNFQQVLDIYQGIEVKNQAEYIQTRAILYEYSMQLDDTAEGKARKRLFESVKEKLTDSQQPQEQQQQQPQEQ